MNEARSGENSPPDYTERKITQLRELKTLFWSLDLDEGIRFVADVAGYEKGAFFFLNKSDDKFCVNIKERVLEPETNQLVPGHKEQWKYFETAESAWNFVSKYLKPPIEAYYY